MRNKREHIFSEGLCSVFITALLLVIIYAYRGYFIFGDASLAVQDADIQYVDYLCYLKDVLSGKNSLIYTFDKGLGGTGIAMAAYYFMSPFSLLVIFFEKGQMKECIDLMIALKLITASATFSYYLKKRFPSDRDGVNAFRILLPVCYAMMTYNIELGANFTWLDGMYIFPLMLLGVYYTVREERGLFLIFCTAVSIVINWYTAWFNCLFSALFLVVEYILSDKRKGLFKTAGRVFLQFLMAAGLSAFIFLPNCLALMEGKGGGMDLSMFLYAVFAGNPLNIIKGMSAGMTASRGCPALFAGTIIMMGIIMFFSGGTKEKEKRSAFAYVITVFILVFNVWAVLYAVYMLHFDDLYYYRYGYCGTAYLIFFAAYGILEEKKTDPKKMITGTAVFIALSVIAAVLGKKEEETAVWLTLVLIASFTVLLLLRQKSEKKAVRCFTEGLIILFTVFELVYSAVLVTGKYPQTEDSPAYAAYINDSETLIGKINDGGDPVFRISQTKGRSLNEGMESCTLNLNDGLALGYMSTAAYSSVTEEEQIKVMDLLGYRSCWDTVNPVNTCILPADSLLGVKYVLSDKSFKGLVCKEDAGVAENGRMLYENPYALPSVFSFTPLSGKLKLMEDDPFANINAVYGILSGKNNIFTKEYPGISADGYISIRPADQEEALYISVNTEKRNSGIYIFHGTDVYAVCGNDGQNTVLYIPMEFKNGDSYELFSWAPEGTLYSVSCYGMNEESLKEAVETIRNGDGVLKDSLKMKNGRVSVKTVSDKGEYLFTSIPAAEGWSAKINGEDAEILSFMDSLIMLELREGENDIELNYTLPGIREGILISMLSLMMIFVIYRKKRERI
ncbi:MAG: YfhO family protein [Lachnospiraceae bacterium]|nr:YfhO family protein [Lachnospiraceae bacterium]